MLGLVLGDQPDCALAEFPRTLLRHGNDPSSKEVPTEPGGIQADLRRSGKELLTPKLSRPIMTMIRRF